MFQNFYLVWVVLTSIYCQCKQSGATTIEFFLIRSSALFQLYFRLHLTNSAHRHFVVWLAASKQKRKVIQELVAFRASLLPLLSAYMQVMLFFFLFLHTHQLPNIGTAILHYKAQQISWLPIPFSCQETKSNFSQSSVSPLHVSPPFNLSKPLSSASPIIRSSSSYIAHVTSQFTQLNSHKPTALPPQKHPPVATPIFSISLSNRSQTSSYITFSRPSLLKNNPISYFLHLFHSFLHAQAPHPIPILHLYYLPYYL